MTTHAAKGAVVVGYDATPHSDAALDWAVRYATDHGRPLLITHAAGVPTVYENLAGPTENRKELRIAGRRVTDRALVLVKERAPGLDVSVHLALGNAHDVLLDSAFGAHLLVVGSRGRGSLASLLLGSVSVGVSAHAPCPVAVIRPEIDRARFGPFVGRIVVGVDGSDASMGALDFAFELASAEYKPLAILHAWGAAGVYKDLMSYEVRLETAEEHELQVAESIAGYAEKYPDVLVTQHQDEDDPSRTLVTASEDADTVVVGSRGRRDAASVVFGSVSRFVVEHAHCPVIVVRRPA
jgi:nucleotide-binding universal stress UspA family protein